MLSVLENKGMVHVELTDILDVYESASIQCWSELD